MKQLLQNDLKSAMLGKDSVKVNVIRMIKKNITELETSPGRNNSDASDEEILKIIQKMVKQSKDAVQSFKEANRMDLVEDENKQILVLESYLPKQLTETEIEEEVKKVMTETGLNQIGPLMKELNKRLSGRTDGKTISMVLKRIL